MSDLIQTTWNVEWNGVGQATFDYSSLDKEVGAFAREKAIEIRALMKRSAEDIVMIGITLMDVKDQLGHGKFMDWVQSEFGMSQMTATKFMNVAKAHAKFKLDLSLPASVLYELSAPSTPNTVVEMVQTGEIPPYLDAIKEAKEAAKRAEEAERQAHAEKETAQQQRFQLERSIERRMQEQEQEYGQRLREYAQKLQVKQQEYNQQIQNLQGRLATIPKPEIKEVEKQVTPPEIVAQIERYRQQIATLTEQRNNLAKEAEELGEIARNATQQRQEREHDDRVRQQWRTTCITFNQAVLKALSQWPTPIDTQIFEGDDWSYLSQVQETAQRFLQECTNLRGKQEWIVDAVEA